MVFEGWKLVPTPKRQELDPAGKRRQRLIMQIDKQLRFVESHNQGRKVRGRWWSIEPDGKPTLAIKYGKFPLELAKGRHGIACGDMNDVIAALEKAKTAVTDGAFDAQLEAISEKVRARFNKGKAGR